MSEAEKKTNASSHQDAQYGIDAVREAIAEKLLEDADKVAEGLIAKAKEGNLAAFKVAYQVAGEDKAIREALERALSPKRSLAAEWASEPEWSGDDAEGMAWWASKRASVK
jgi:DNA-binding phage protein